MILRFKTRDPTQLKAVVEVKEMMMIEPAQLFSFFSSRFFSALLSSVALQALVRLPFPVPLSILRLKEVKKVLIVGPHLGGRRKKTTLEDQQKVWTLLATYFSQDKREYRNQVHQNDGPVFQVVFFGRCRKRWASLVITKHQTNNLLP